ARLTPLDPVARLGGDQAEAGLAMTVALHSRTRTPPALAAGIAQRVLALSTRNPRRALRLAHAGLQRGTAARPEPRARLLRAYGRALRAVGRYREARMAYLGSRRLFRRLGLEHERAIGALGLVDACMFLGRTSEALRAAAEARAVFVRDGDFVR